MISFDEFRGLGMWTFQPMRFKCWCSRPSTKDLSVIVSILNFLNEITKHDQEFLKNSRSEFQKPADVAFFVQRTFDFLAITRPEHFSRLDCVKTQNLGGGRLGALIVQQSQDGHRKFFGGEIADATEVQRKFFGGGASAAMEQWSFAHRIGPSLHHWGCLPQLH